VRCSSFRVLNVVILRGQLIGYLPWSRVRGGDREAQMASPVSGSLRHFLSKNPNKLRALTFGRTNIKNAFRFVEF